MASSWPNSLSTTLPKPKQTPPAKSSWQIGGSFEDSSEFFRSEPIIIAPEKPQEEKPKLESIGKLVFTKVDVEQNETKTEIKSESITFEAPKGEPVFVDIPKDYQKNIFESLNPVASVATGAMEATGKIVPGAAKEVAGAVTSLFTEYIIPGETKPKEGNDPKKNQEAEKKKMENRLIINQRVEVMADDKRRAVISEQEKIMKIALGMVERTDVVVEDLVDLDLNTSLDKKHIKSIYHINQLRQKLLAKKQAAQKAKKQQSIQQTTRKKGKAGLDLNKVDEGGSILSSTGGAGAG